jgi:hypothetical protein
VAECATSGVEATAVHARTLLATILVPLLPLTARAGDGAVEINQVCATQTGCLPGDAPGFPVTIDGAAANNFLLTSDLVVPDADTTAIAVTIPFTQPAANVDLNNFQIVGPVTCNFVGTYPTISVTCSASGSGVGIDGNALVREGTITGMGAGGARVIYAERVTASSNAGFGIEARGARLCAANLNGGDGFNATIGALYEQLVAIANGGVGFRGNPQSYPRAVNLRYGSFSLNAGGGAILGELSEVSESTFELNAPFGISTTAAGVLVTRSSIGVHIPKVLVCTGRCSVRESSVYAMELTPDSGYADNTLPGPNVTGGVNLGGNLCGTAVCP